MPDESSEPDTEKIEDDEWHLYANAGYGVAESLEEEPSEDDDEARRRVVRWRRFL